MNRLILSALLLVAMVAAVPTCRFKEDENGLYTCYLTDGVVLVDDGSITIGGKRKRHHSLIHLSF
jgi:hypothetical protein